MMQRIAGVLSAALLFVAGMAIFNATRSDDPINKIERHDLVTVLPGLIGDDHRTQWFPHRRRQATTHPGDQPDLGAELCRHRSRGE